MSISIHGYVCKNNVDEKIVLVLLHWSFNTTDMFGSHTWRVEGGGGHYFNWGKPQIFGGVCWSYWIFTPIQGLLVFISFHVGLMKCMLSSFQLLP